MENDLLIKKLDSLVKEENKELTIEGWNSTVKELKGLTDEEGNIYFSSEYLDKLLK